ncbi:hypothetical protein D7V20_03140 [Acinetobacter rongchengensis]|uniref:Uncharacterized protein n=1 Tax=Acinetobacter rongchengensis TaxID=2419601 RepID=A0A3A8FH53_9GAMM|nr:hypothetical protein D7V20_03140 [Acinetobacter rongchengensis]
MRDFKERVVITVLHCFRGVQGLDEDGFQDLVKNRPKANIDRLRVILLLLIDKSPLTPLYKRGNEQHCCARNPIQY